MRIPPKKVFSRLNIPAPIMAAKKKSLRSAPRMVSGRLSVRKTGLMRCCTMSGSRKEPSHEVDGADGHADAEDDAGQGSLRAAFTKGENEAANHDGHKREAGGNGPRE